MITVATIAGFDPTGGAGVLADQTVFEAHGLHCVAAITCHVPQTADRVFSVNPVAPQIFDLELKALNSLPDLRAIKVGAIGSAELIPLLSAFLKNKKEIPTVIDPVLSASDGTILLPSDAWSSFLSTIATSATLLTPNRNEAFQLVSNAEDSAVEEVAFALVEKGGPAVLIKTAQQTENRVDDLFLSREKGKIQYFSSSRKNFPMPHGSGCRLSSAITANLAQGLDLIQSITQGRRWFENILLR